MAATSAYLALRVRPGARRTALQRSEHGEWRLDVSARPVDGKANQACIAFLAKALGVRRTAVTLTGGKTSRQKRFRVAGLTESEIAERLGAAATR